MDRIYYFSNYDCQLHNINDTKPKVINERTAHILAGEGEVIDEVSLLTAEEVIDCFARTN